MGKCSICGNEEKRLIGGICTVCMQVQNREIKGEEDDIMNGVEEEHSQGNDGGSLFDLAAREAQMRTAKKAKAGSK